MLERFFTTAGVDPYSQVDWDLRSAVISGEDGRVVFEQKDVEVPRAWSQTATNVVVSKYFRGPLGTPRRETSVRQLISRVVDTISGWGDKQGYFADADARDTFHAELKYLLLNQKASFNSPVYFNVGIEAKPQCSACFILKVDDSMDSILSWYRNEGMIFKGGSGAGVNLSALRGCREKLSAGGTASGPLSFMKAADACAGVIKSGGKTRRAAKMVVLNADHPDIVDFIKCKVEEEKKAWALIEAGYDSSLDGPAYGSVFFQNANNSVRATDGFMQAVLDDADWQTHFVKSSEVAETRPAREILHMIAEAAHACGDPGMQFDTTINLWHTCPASGRINASNPCSEYMHLDNSACNLASLNLMKFIDDRGEFDVRAFRHAVDVMITAQDIVVDNSSYPTDEIAKNASAFRELGLGYANLGALLMALGMPYDSDQGRSYAAAITALMTGEAYLQSARIAEQMGPFAGYAPNREPMLKVIERHKAAAYKLDPSYVPLDLLRAARDSWDDALKVGTAAGYRNSQATVIAPTGTIAFMMDCDTTGIEPDIALIKYKKLVGGGMLKIVNGTVPRALKRLGYDSKEVQEIVEYLDENETIEGAPQLADAHLAVFDCAFKPRAGARTIHYNGHIKMMGAVQPFISGAISKTINMPAEATVDEVAEAYVTAWKLGLKAVAIYRDGSKRTQPLNTGRKDIEKAVETRLRVDRVGRRSDAAAQAARRAQIDHAQVRYRRPRGLHHGRHVRGRHAGRDFRLDVEAGLDDFGPDGFVCDGDFVRAAVRRAAAVPGRQIRAHALRAVGLHQESADPVRQVDRRLPVPLDGVEVPRRRSQARSRNHRVGENVCRQNRTQRPHGRDGSSSQSARRQRRRHPAGVHQSGRRAAVSGLRQHHGAQRRLLQMHELRHHERVLIKKESKGPGELWRGGFRETGDEVDAEGQAGRSAAAKKVSASPRRKWG